MKYLLLMTALVLAGRVEASPLKTIHCTTTFDGKEESISLKMDAEGELLYWSESKMAETSPHGLFQYFSNPPEEGFFEYLHTDLSRTGVASMTVGTTADEVKISIAKSLDRGTFTYRDLGSGSGNQRYPLVCEVDLE